MLPAHAWEVNLTHSNRSLSNYITEQELTYFETFLFKHPCITSSKENIHISHLMFKPYMDSSSRIIEKGIMAVLHLSIFR